MGKVREGDVLGRGDREVGKIEKLGPIRLILRIWIKCNCFTADSEKNPFVGGVRYAPDPSAP
jgi:hypothetical protein